MAVVSIKGVYMGSNIKKSIFDGKEKSSLYIDVYQPDSVATEKTVQIKSDDLSLINDFNKDYSMGSVFECFANVNAYQNRAYFKLIKLVNGK